MPLVVLSLVIQVAFVLHVLKTGRNTTWIWVVVMLPFAGSVAYFIMEVWPDMAQSRTGRDVGRNVRKTINPNRDIKNAFQAFEANATIETQQNLAQEFLKKGNFSEAKELFQRCLVGGYEFDPNTLFGRARAEFGLEEFEQCRGTLDLLIAENPDYKNADAHLLYARALESSQKYDEARHEFEALHQYYPGPEATYRLADLLQREGLDSARATELWQGILDSARRAGKPYQKMHSQWIDLARKALKNRNVA